MNIAELIAEHEIQLEWFPNVLWISSKKYKIDTIGIKRLDLSNEQVLERGINKFMTMVEHSKWAQ